MVQQAKAYSNMSATYTMLNDFNQAITCADNVICLARFDPFTPSGFVRWLEII